MAGRLYKRGSIWWAWYYDRDGRRVQRSTRCLDKRAATEVLRRWERGEQAPGGPASHAPQTVRDACEALLGEPNVTAGTQHMREVKAGHLARLLGGKRLAVLTTDDVRAYCATRHDEEGAAPGTVAKELSTLSQALRVAGERGWWKGDARTLLPRWRTGYTPRDLWLTRDQVAALCGELEPHRALWAWVATHAGLRASEIEALTWADVDGGWLRVRGTKTAKARRMVPLADPLALVLGWMRPAHAEGPVVRPWPNVRRDLHAACERAGVPKVSPNDLRRTFASWLKQAGVDSMTVGRLLGHTSSRMVEAVYGHLSGDTLRAAVDALGSH